MSIIERIREKAANAEPLTMGEYLELLSHIQEIERGYQQMIAIAGGFKCSIGTVRRWSDAA